MRSRATLTLLLFLILLLIILAQSGALGNIFSGLGKITPVYYGPTVAPLSFSTAVPPSNQLIPAPYVPTMYVPPTFGQPQVPSSGQQPVVTPPPAGVVANGSCIVPNGWTAYTIQQGDTLAIIASNYGLTVEQLASANCMSNPDLIYAGQMIAVPGSASQ